MISKTVMCLDSELLNYPEILGLEDENIASQPWLDLYCDALEVRKDLRSKEAYREAWIVSSDSMEGINLAAALKHDNPRLSVSLVSFEPSGSVMGRCEVAGIDLIRSKRNFLEKFSERKDAYRAKISLDKQGSIPREPDASVSSLVVEEPNWDSNMRTQSIEESENFPDAEMLGKEKRHSRSANMQSSMTNNASTNEDMGRSIKKNSDTVSKRQNEQISSFNQVDLKEQPRTLMNRKENRQEVELETYAQREFLRKLDSFLPNIKEETKAFVLAIVSGSGGSGKSTIALSTAMVYQEMGYKTLLLDADLQFGDMAYMLGCDSALSIMDLIDEPERITRINPENDLPAVIEAPQYLEHSELAITQMANIIRLVKRFFDVVIINTGSFWAEHHAQIIESSDKTLFILDQRPSSVRACCRALDLCARCGIATQPFMYALNFCSRHALLTPIDISCALQGASVEEIKDGGKEVGELLGASLPKELFSSKNVFCESIRELCSKLIPNDKGEQALGKFSSNTHAKKKSSLFGLRRRRAACL